MKRNTSLLAIFIAIPLLAQENPKALIPALTAEQKAYQTLLRLQAHEFEVTRQQQKNLLIYKVITYLYFHLLELHNASLQELISVLKLFYSYMILH